MLHLPANTAVVTGSPPAAPLATPLLIDDDTLGWIPAEDGDPDRAFGWHLHRGLRLAHWPIAEENDVALHLLGGAHTEKGYEDEGFLTRLTRAELQQLIADLRAIDRAMENAR